MFVTSRHVQHIIPYSKLPETRKILVTDKHTSEHSGTGVFRCVPVSRGQQLLAGPGPWELLCNLLLLLERPVHRLKEVYALLNLSRTTHTTTHTTTHSAQLIPTCIFYDNPNVSNTSVENSPPLNTPWTMPSQVIAKFLCLPLWNTNVGRLSTLFRVKQP